MASIRKGILAVYLSAFISVVTVNHLNHNLSSCFIVGIHSHMNRSQWCSRLVCQPIIAILHTLNVKAMDNFKSPITSISIDFEKCTIFITRNTSYKHAYHKTIMVLQYLLYRRAWRVSYRTRMVRMMGRS